MMIINDNHDHHDHNITSQALPPFLSKAQRLEGLLRRGPGGRKSGKSGAAEPWKHCGLWETHQDDGCFSWDFMVI